MNQEFERLRTALAGRYEVLQEIGQGGMATVYLAEDLRHDRKVAVKVLNPDLSQSLGAERFLQEIKTAAKLTHPHILPLHDSGEADGFLFYVMPYVTGDTLRTQLDKEGRIPVEEAVRITWEIAGALAHAHREGIIHRDVKPANIMFEAGHAFLADFGVAEALAEAREVRLTQTGGFVGTPAYMSPEQGMGDEDLDGRSDQYALGCVLFEMLTGEPPFPEVSVSAVMASHRFRNAPQVRTLRPEVPTSLARIVERSLEKSPADRFEQARDMAEALAQVRAGLWGTGLGIRARWRWLSRSTGRRVSLGLLGVSAVLVFLLARFLVPTQEGTQHPSSWVVLPFRGSLTTQAEEELLVGLTDELTRQLDRWDSVSAVPQISLTGIWFDRGFDEPALERVDDGLDVAREVGAGKMVALRVSQRGDSVRLSADLFDSRTREVLGSTLEAWGPIDDLAPAAADLSYRILGLQASAAEVDQLRHQTSVPGALVEYESGKRALEEWDLEEAEARLETAIQLDHGFAMAHHRLALARFWRWEEVRGDPGVLGAEISRFSQAALSSSRGLPLRDSLHIDAFHSFQAGDYQRARALYSVLLERDSTDVYAWLLQGSLERHDPWLRELPSGELRPRSNLNVARRSAEEVTRLSPGFQGAFGTIREIAAEVVETAERGSAHGFEPPRGEFLAPWENSESPENLRPFRSVYLDSLVWLDDTQWQAIPDSIPRAGANRLLQESLVELRRWAAYRSDQARPQQELARTALSLRSGLVDAKHWAQADSLTNEALRHASRALALSPDTTPVDLFRLANLHLASGDPTAARYVWGLAWEEAAPDEGGVVPSMALNLLIYSGRPNDALDHLPRMGPRLRYYPDPVTGGYIEDGGAERPIQRLQILGATQVGGLPLEEAVRDLLDRWRTGRRPVRHVDFLRTVTAPRIAVALSRSPTLVRSWTQDLELRDPLWSALESGERERAARFREALQTGETGIRGASRAFLLGRLAQDVGDPRESLRWFSRLDSLAFRVDQLDPGWGLLALSYFYRGRAHLVLGQVEEATRFYRRFTEAWVDPDADGSLVQEARARLQELSRRPARIPGRMFPARLP